MECILSVANALLPLLYLALLIDYGATFFLRTRSQARNPGLLALVVVHAAVLAARAIHTGHPPVTEARDILSVLALTTAAVYAYVEFAAHDRRTGVFVLLLAFLFQYASTISLAGCGPEAAPGGFAEAHSLWSRLHTLPAMVAYTASALAGVYGLMYLLAQRSLRQQRFGLFFDRLPPLDLLGPMTWHAVLTAFACITLTIAVTPLLFHGDDGGGLSAKVLSKIITGSVAWIVYAAAIFGRWFGKWHMARIAVIAVVGFAAVMALLIASAVLS